MKNTNRKLNKTKLIARLMLVVMLLTLVATTGCSLIPQKTTEENKHHEPEDLVNGMLAKMQAAGYEKMEGIAYAFLKAPYLDRQYNLEVEIVNESIFLNGVIYDEITYDNNYELKYDDAMLAFVLARQAVWVVLLYLFGSFIWKKVTRRLEVLGG